MSRKKHLLFVSPRFLFPVDSGGKIRTTQVLRGLKDGAFETTLLSPAERDSEKRFSHELGTVSDRCQFWLQPKRRRIDDLLRLRYLFSALPIPVATNRSKNGRELVRRQLQEEPAAVVFDFAHAAVLAPQKLSVPSILFTHNVEAEIFKRHAQINSNPVKRLIWQNQHRKMEAFERSAAHRFDTVVAVSARDLGIFNEKYGVRKGYVISTGVDLDFFNYQSPGDRLKLVFTGSMDWLANIDGIEFMMDEVWPLVVKEFPGISLDIVGRNPPASLQHRAQGKGFKWNFTGFVDDIREYVRDATVFVIPLRVGGGTRLKVYEAMAMGAPVVSTGIGVEGLPLIADKHYLLANSAEQFAAAIAVLLRDRRTRDSVSQAAHQFVKTNCSYRTVAKEFEEICLSTIENFST